MTIPGVVVLGIALLIAGWLLGIWILWIAGAIVLIAALLMLLFGMAGHPVRRGPY